MINHITIRGDSIRLGQLLKLAGVIDSGSQAKALLAQAPALVNGQPETRRGRQLRNGDSVLVREHQLLILADADAGAGAEAEAGADAGAGAEAGAGAGADAGAGA